MFPVGAIVAAAVGAAAHARQAAEQKRRIASAAPVWAQVAARLGLQTWRDPGGCPAMSGVVDDVPCALRLVAVSATAARVDAQARARVAAPWRVGVRAAPPKILRWLTGGGDVTVGDLAFDGAFAVRSTPREAAARLFDASRARELLVGFRGRGVKLFVYDQGNVWFSWPGVEVDAAPLERALELLVAVARHDPAAEMPYR